MENKIEFKTLHSNKHRIYFLCGIVCVVVLMVTLIVTTSKAKYKTTQSLPLINGTINYDLSDLNLIGAYIQEGEEYIQTNEIPSSGYEFNSEKSYCTVNGENINVTINFDIETQTLSVVPLTKKGTKCYLYFDEKASGSEYILAGPNAPTSHTTDWTGKESYYYTGNPNNWVSFAGFYWRIIRINGDRSIRMIYQGVNDSLTPDEGNMTGEETQIGTSTFNSSYNNNMYVGFKYTSNQVHGTGINSTILGEDDSNNTATLNGWYIRLYNKGTSNSNPSLQCDREDVYTTNNSSSGNKSLQYPIGLLTADEAALTGITWNNANTESYLYIGEYYWTMSPYDFSGGSAGVFLVNSNGTLYYLDRNVNDINGVRPVINLRSDVSITGTGTVDDPFKVVGA